MNKIINSLENSVFTHPLYGEYKVLSREKNTGSKNNIINYKIKFLNTGFETISKASNIRNLLVRDKKYDFNLIGKIITNNHNQTFEVIEKVSSDKFKIKYILTNTIQIKRHHAIIKGNTCDKYGMTKMRIYNKELKKMQTRRSATIYNSMKQRVLLKNKAVVCVEWLHTIENFQDWLLNTEIVKHNVSLYDFETYKVLLNYHLDKDLLSDSDNKLYSSSTCRLLPKYFNEQLNGLQNCTLVFNYGTELIEVNNILKFVESLGYNLNIDKTVEKY